MNQDKYFIIMRKGQYLAKAFSFYEPRRCMLGCEKVKWPHMAEDVVYCSCKAHRGWTDVFRDARQYKTLGAARGALTNLLPCKGYVNVDNVVIKQVVCVPQIMDID